MVDIFDNATERVEERFSAMVESVRIGTVIAHDRKALNQWRNRRYHSAQKSHGMSGEALEAAVMNLASMYPGHVTRGVMPPEAA